MMQIPKKAVILVSGAFEKSKLDDQLLVMREAAEIQRTKRGLANKVNRSVAEQVDYPLYVWWWAEE